MPNRFHDHQTGEDLENYSLGKLSRSRVRPLEEHLLICQPCRARLTAIEPYNFVHYTSDGPIHSRVTKLQSGLYAARHWGRRLEGGKQFQTRRGAQAFLIRTFSQMFPEHTCTKRCGIAHEIQIKRAQSLIR